MADDNAAFAMLDFDTARLPADDRFAAWSRALSNFDLSRAETDPFAARARVWFVDPLILTHAHVAPLRYDRGGPRAQADANDHFAMVYLIAGGFVGDYGAGPVASGPGSLTVLDMRRPCWTEADALEAYILSIPRAPITATLGDVEPHGMVADVGCAPLLGAALREIVAALPSLTRDHGGLIGGMTRDLVVQALRDAAAAPGVMRPRDDALIVRVRDHIDAHIAADLDAASICTALGVSRSALYRAFEGSGGVQRQIQRRRLQRLRAALVDRGERRSIAEIATALGFADKSHAARLFKQAFGATPGQYRERGRGEMDVALENSDAPRVFEHWTTLLD